MVLNKKKLKITAYMEDCGTGCADASGEEVAHSATTVFSGCSDTDPPPPTKTSASIVVHPLGIGIQSLPAPPPPLQTAIPIPQSAHILATTKRDCWLP